MSWKAAIGEICCLLLQGDLNLHECALFVLGTELITEGRIVAVTIQ